MNCGLVSRSRTAAGSLSPAQAPPARGSELPCRPGEHHASKRHLLERGHAQNSAVDTVNTLLSTLDSQNLIAVVHQTGSQFESVTYPGLIDQLTQSADTGGKTRKPTVAVASIKAAGGPAIIETEPDVDAYLAALRVSLVQAIKENRIAN